MCIAAVLVVAALATSPADVVRVPAGFERIDPRDLGDGDAA